MPESGESFTHKMVVPGDEGFTHGSAFDSTMVANTTPSGRRIVTTQASNSSAPDSQKPPAKAN